MEKKTTGITPAIPGRDRSCKPACRRQGTNPRLLRKQYFFIPTPFKNEFLTLRNKKIPSQ